MSEPMWLEQVRAINREFTLAGERFATIYGPVVRQMNEQLATALPRAAKALVDELKRMEAPGDH